MRAQLRACGGLLLFVGAAFLLLRAGFWLLDAREQRAERISVGSKADTEGLLLAEIMAQLMEHAGLRVERRTLLGGTQICFHALLEGEIDVYPEYTGTALIALVERPPETDPRRTYDIVERALRERYGLELLTPMAFDNTYALAMREDEAERLKIRTISDLRSHAELRAGFTSEFLGRQDGYPGLARAYGLRFDRAPVSLEAGLMYDAVARGKVDVIAAYATDGRIDKFALRTLHDDRRFFPPYQAAPLLGRLRPEDRSRVLRALRPLGGQLGDAEIRRMNAAIDLERKTPSAVARAFVQRLLRRAPETR